MTEKITQRAFERLFRLYAVPSSRMHLPARCAPSTTELEQHPREHVDLKGNTGKIMFAGRREAEGFSAAAREVDTTNRLEAYECPRGGHWHVRNADKMAAKKARLRQ